MLDGHRQDPALHRQICDWLQDTQDSARRLLMAFRFCGKSDLVTKYVAWRLLEDPDFETIIVSAGAKVPGRNSRAIKKIIEKNPLTRHLVNEDDQWGNTQFTVKGKRIALNPSVQVTSISAPSTT